MKDTEGIPGYNNNYLLGNRHNVYQNKTSNMW